MSQTSPVDFLVAESLLYSSAEDRKIHSQCATDDSASPMALELLFDRIADALEAQGYIVLQQILSDNLIRALCAVLTDADESLDLQPAGVGRANNFQLNREIRRDKIQWLEPGKPAVTEFLS